MFEMREILKSAVLIDSKGGKHTLNLLRVHGGYTFTWDDIEVDWSFSPRGGYQAMRHFKGICESVEEVDYMNNWVKG